LPDHVEKHGAIVVVAPVHRGIEELGDLQLYAIAHLQRTVILGILVEGDAVKIWADQGRGNIEIIFRPPW